MLSRFSLSKQRKRRPQKPAIMWCQRCQQDVPGVALASGIGYGCARCGTRMGGSVSGPVSHTIRVAEAADGGLDLAESPLIKEPLKEPLKVPIKEPFEEKAPSLELDDWDMDEDWPELLDLPEPQSRGTACPPGTRARLYYVH